MKKTIKERQLIKEDILAKSKHYQDLLINKVTENKQKEREELNVPIYEKSFLINRELDSIAIGLGTYITEKIDK